MRAKVQKVFFATPREKQVLMFTATLPAETRTLAKKFMHNVCPIMV